MKPAAQDLLSRILALLLAQICSPFKLSPYGLTGGSNLPSPYLRDSLKALLLLLLQGHGKARPQHSKTKSPSALSHFLNQVV